MIDKKVIPIGREKIRRHRSCDAEAAASRSFCPPETASARSAGAATDRSGGRTDGKPLCLFQLLPPERMPAMSKSASNSSERIYQFMDAAIRINHLAVLPLTILMVQADTGTLSILVDNRTGIDLQNNLEQAVYPHLNAFIRHVVRLAAASSE